MKWHEDRLGKAPAPSSAGACEPAYSEIPRLAGISRHPEEPQKTVYLHLERIAHVRAKRAHTGVPRAANVNITPAGRIGTARHLQFACIDGVRAEAFDRANTRSQANLDCYATLHEWLEKCAVLIAAL